MLNNQPETAVQPETSTRDTDLESKRIAVIGLGYVGLPLAVEFAKQYQVVGFDINRERVGELAGGMDKTLEVDNQILQKVLIKEQYEAPKTGLFISHDLHHIANCNFYVVTVPTPTDKNNRPDLVPLQRASKSVGQFLKKGDYVVYESTVYPGATEEECVPILEKKSGLKLNRDFFVGYSPERINPGDKKHSLTKILKVTSGSTPAAAALIDQVYKKIIDAGTFCASSIKVAEAAKVIENSQRDINIAFINELAKIFNRLGIDTHEVLEAAGTKWNFLHFKPGLVGGHCIGVDPYYLAQKAQEVGYHPEIILAGRRLNDSMGSYVAGEVVKLMVKKDIAVKNSRVLMLGITFKENCPDIRNTRAIDVYSELKSYSINVEVYDPWANAEEVKKEFGIDLITSLAQINQHNYQAIILAVAHREFEEINLTGLKNKKVVIYDVKGVLDKSLIDQRL